VAKVLIVEDDHDIAVTICDILEAEGYDAVIAASQFTANDEALALHPDVVLLDLMMPGVNGVQVAQRLQQDETTRDIPVIVMSAWHRMEDAAKQIGTPFTLAKPFNLIDLYRVVTQALASSAGTAA
jgi:CheY-like chemotaxis protein